MPERFVRALLSLRQADHLPHILLEEVPSPRGLAPFAAALAMRTTDEDDAGQPLSTGRIVILHDPVEQIGWNGTFRMVGQLRTQIDSEMIADPLLAEGVWGWTHDCLDAAGAGFHDLTGTVTREISEAFGGLELRGSSLFVDVRASWTPNSEYLGEHLSGWADVMRRTAGIVPTRHLEGV
ncbi:DUF3000 family protein [Schaalia meyeri]|uniref:DUF3000 family protein n=1 Tax=Schaalia meyeri TaxID=52773 RepID=A0AAQ0BXP8_9ACTO|nr:DUF3000 family protein [Schaalia meyeri]